MERSPASRLGIVSIDAEGNRRDHYFGELVAQSAGLSGAFAARGVRRGDVVMTLVGNRIEWVLDAACLLADGGGGAALQHDAAAA